MDSNKKLWIAVVVVAIIAVMGLFKGNVKEVSLGAVECATGQTCLNSIELTGPLSGVTNALQIDAGTFNTAGDSVFGGGTLNITTSNTATSTAIVGCIQTYATSTATAVKLTLARSPNATSTYSGAGLSDGFVVWNFGTCPNL